MVRLKTYQRVETKLVRERAPEAYNPTIRTTDNAISVTRDLQDADREKFVVLHLDTKLRLTCVEVTSIGTIDACLVQPREIFKTALLTNASALILVHNHPSGDATPSQNDLAITRRLSDAGSLMGVDVLDHIIVGSEGRHTSLRGAGLMPKR